MRDLICDSNSVYEAQILGNVNVKPEKN